MNNLNSDKMKEFYLSHDELGFLIKCIINKYGLDMNHKGLYVNINYLLKNNTNNNIIYLSNEPIKICEYLDLDYGKWQNLKSVEESYYWLINSKFFNKNICNNSIYVNNNIYKDIFDNFMNFIKNIPNKEKNTLMTNKKMDAINYFNKFDELNHTICENNKNIIKKII